MARVQTTVYTCDICDSEGSEGFLTFRIALGPATSRTVDACPLCASPLHIAWQAGSRQPSRADKVAMGREVSNPSTAKPPIVQSEQTAPPVPLGTGVSELARPSQVPLPGYSYEPTPGDFIVAPEK